MPYDWIYNLDIQNFVRNFPYHEVQKLLLRKPVFTAVSNQELAQQIMGLHIATRKFPFLLNFDNIIYPPTLHLEQSSSEATAQYKASLITGMHLMDISSGFGIDAMHFAKRFHAISLNEPNNYLYDLAKHNFKELGITLRHLYSQAAETLHLPDDVDWWYADPSRRVQGQKKFLPQDCLPDLHAFKAVNRGDLNFMVKYSPMLDISSGLNYLPDATEVHVVSVEGECKELLFVRRYSINNHEPHEVKVFATDISKNLTYSTIQTPLHDIGTQQIAWGLKPRYLYEPNASLMKAGAFNHIALRYGLHKLDTNTHLYSSEHLVHDFPGKIFQIEHVHTDSLKSLPVKQKNLHVKVRNYPISAEELSKKLKVKPEGDLYLFACTVYKNKKVLILTRRITPAP